MQKKLNLLSIIIFLILTVTFSINADIRTESIELFLVIDKSKSMVEEIKDVTSYINETFVREFLIPGDRLVLIQFYGKADIIYDGIMDKDNKNMIISDISDIPADGRFTDIGNALDTLSKTVSRRADNGIRKYLILLTDGKQEAPPESPYYSPDGSFNHEFLENTKIIQKAGWKIMILGIGPDTAVEELAAELGTTHEIVDFNESSSPAVKSSSEIIGRILATDFDISDGVLKLILKSEGYQTARNIIVEQILFQHRSGNFELIDSPENIRIEADSELTISINLSDDKLKELDDVNDSGSILFKFSGDTPFLPAVFDTGIGPALLKNGSEDKKVSESSENIRNNEVNWLIIVIVILVVAAIIAFIIIRNLIFHRDEDEGKRKKQDEISSDR